MTSLAGEDAAFVIAAANGLNQLKALSLRAFESF